MNCGCWNSIFINIFLLGGKFSLMDRIVDLSDFDFGFYPVFKKFNKFSSFPLNFNIHLPICVYVYDWCFWFVFFRVFFFNYYYYQYEYSTVAITYPYRFKCGMCGSYDDVYKRKKKISVNLSVKFVKIFMNFFGLV